MKPRIIKSVDRYKIGDLVMSKTEDMEFPLLCIITENPVDGKHVQCVRVCNFTEHPLKGKEKYAIYLSRFELPPEVYSYLKIPKYSNWILWTGLYTQSVTPREPRIQFN